jgi:ATP-dependent DNA ligase
MWAALPALSKRLNLGAGSRTVIFGGIFFCAGHASLVFRHACKMGLEGIVSKRLGSRYRSGRSPDWLKMKKAEEDWR